MKKQKLLIAVADNKKFAEIKKFLGDLPFTLCSSDQRKRKRNRAALILANKGDEFSIQDGKSKTIFTVFDKKRGKNLIILKYYLQNQYCAKHVVVPVALIIKNGKMLITLRNDPHRPEMHKKWEMPGGIVDFRETAESTIIKETREETGYKVKIIKQLQGIAVKDHQFPNSSYQVYLIPFVCKIIGGKLRLNDAEVLKAKWISPENYKKFTLMPGDNKYLRKLLPELIQVIKDYKL